MKRHITLKGIRYANGKTAGIAYVRLTDSQARTLARLFKKWEDGKDGNIFRQAATSFADAAAQKMGIAHYAAIGY
ncbi:MAG: hypothetical protein MJ074_06480 [Oscillospiraceae bacterium]|nr:hypothetical protein [Oscillospiraceae bacterium]